MKSSKFLALPPFQPQRSPNSPALNTSHSYPQTDHIMQFNLPLALALASSFFIFEASAESGFGGSCNSITSYNRDYSNSIRNKHGYLIFANCRKRSGIYEVGVEMNLDLCIANAGGRIQAQPGYELPISILVRLLLTTNHRGDFSPSCRSLDLSGTTVTTSCGDGRGGWVTSSLNLSKFP